jgi:hypothetical protein
VVSPVTLRPRFNAVATDAEGSAADQLPPDADLRQMSLFGAGWTLGSIKYLAESGAHSTTYFETVGPCGVMEREEDSALPAKFPSQLGIVFPLYHVLADIGEYSNAVIWPYRSSAPLRVDGLVLQREGEKRILLANFTPQMQNVRVGGCSDGATVKHLHEGNAAQAMLAPQQWRATVGEQMEVHHGVAQIELAPYAVARIDTHHE